jgi:hypothetical protein
MCGDQIFDLHLCLSASVNVRPILHTQPLGLYLKSQMGISLSTVIPNLSSHPPSSLSHLFFRWPTQETTTPMLRATMLRTTMLPTHHRH